MVTAAFISYILIIDGCSYNSRDKEQKQSKSVVDSSILMKNYVLRMHSAVKLNECKKLSKTVRCGYLNLRFYTSNDGKLCKIKEEVDFTKIKMIESEYLINENGSLFYAEAFIEEHRNLNSDTLMFSEIKFYFNSDILMACYVRSRPFTQNEVSEMSKGDYRSNVLNLVRKENYDSKNAFYISCAPKILKNFKIYLDCFSGENLSICDKVDSPLM